MFIENNSQINCRNLFNKDSKEIFSNVKINDRRDHQKYIDSCLQLSMKVCSLLFEREDALIFFSCAVAANEACPLYTYRLVTIKETYAQKTEEEKLNSSEENRFLLLSLFLNTILLSGQPLSLVKVFSKVIKENKLIRPGRNPRFHEFLHDDGKMREYASRKAYNELFETYMKNKLSELSLHSPVFKDLDLLAQQNLTITYPNFRHQKLYTYPIFGILMFLVKEIEEDKLGVIVRIKVITQEGVTGYIKGTIGKIKNVSSPVMVLNGIATDGSFGIGDYRMKGQSCPHNYFHYESQRLLHAQNENCFFCKEHPASTSNLLSQIEESCSKVLANPKELFYAFAVDSIISDPELYRAVSESEKFPELKNIIHEYKPKVMDLGLSSNKPTTFSVATVHLSTLQMEEKRDFYLDVTPKEFTKGFEG